MNDQESYDDQRSKSAGEKDDRYLLRWHDYEDQVTRAFSQSYRTKEFADIVLICGGSQFLAHQIVLSAFSKYLNEILKDHPTDFPIITIDGVSSEDMKSILDYMYLGTAQICDSELPRFFDAAKFLQVRGIENGPGQSDFTRWDSDDKSRDYYDDNEISDDDMESPLNLAPKSENDNEGENHPNHLNGILPLSALSPTTSSEDDNLSKQYPVVNLQIAPSPSHIPDYYYKPPPTQLHHSSSPPKYFPSFSPTSSSSILSRKLMKTESETRSSSSSPNRLNLPQKSFEEMLKNDKQIRAMLDSKALYNIPFHLANLAANPSMDALPQLFTTPSGLVVSTTFDNGRSSSTMHSSSSNSKSHAQFRSSNSSLLFNNTSATIKPNPPPAPKSDYSSSGSHNGGRKRSGLNYSPAQVSAIVESVDSIKGPFLPCGICGKIVKRERLRSHIYECHLVNGEKIPCPVCGVELKSKGSYRVHVWRHRKGSLKNRQMKQNVAAALGNAP